LARKRHFRKHVYDDVVTQDNLSDENLKKTVLRFEMADNLGTRHGVEKQIAGTRYHFADAYGAMIDAGSAKPRIYPATYDGTLATWRTLKDGSVVSNLVLLTPVTLGRRRCRRPIAMHLPLRPFRRAKHIGDQYRTFKELQAKTGVVLRRLAVPRLPARRAFNTATT
jgi:DNA-directed RNA polymerase subunit N (RpoN/RPB10)